MIHMEIDQENYEILRKLEESMWLPETRFDKEYMERTLAPEFFEFGRSGRIYQREDTIHGARPQEIKAKLPLQNLAITLIDANVAQVTYISEVQLETLEKANRSSIWIKTPTGWKLRFHQGTPT